MHSSHFAGLFCSNLSNATSAAELCCLDNGLGRRLSVLGKFSGTVLTDFGCGWVGPHLNNEGFWGSRGWTFSLKSPRSSPAGVSFLSVLNAKCVDCFDPPNFPKVPPLAFLGTKVAKKPHVRSSIFNITP